MPDQTYIVAVAFIVHEHTDEHLHTEPAIRDEVSRWLEGLKGHGPRHARGAGHRRREEARPMD